MNMYSPTIHYYYLILFYSPSPPLVILFSTLPYLTLPYLTFLTLPYLTLPPYSSPSSYFSLYSHSLTHSLSLSLFYFPSPHTLSDISSRFIPLFFKHPS